MEARERKGTNLAKLHEGPELCLSPEIGMGETALKWHLLRVFSRSAHVECMLLLSLGMALDSLIVSLSFNS